MSDLNDKYESNNKEIQEKCLSIMHKAQHVRENKISNHSVRQRIEDLEELARVEKVFILG